MAQMLNIDTSKFGSGFIAPNEQPGSSFVVGGGRWNEETGGAVRAAGYSGTWPIVGSIVSEKKQGKEAKLASTSAERESPASSSPSSHSSKDSNSDTTTKEDLSIPKWLCRTTGKCKACPREELSRSFCQPYGNRAAIECRRLLNATALPSLASTGIDLFDVDSPSTYQLSGMGWDDEAHELVGDFGEQGDDKMTPMAEKAPLALDARHPLDEKGGEVVLVERDERGGGGKIRSESRAFSQGGEQALGNELYQGYQICGRDGGKEAWDYAEFVALNLVIALVSLFVLLQRQRYLAGQRQSILARRVGRPDQF